MLQLAAESGHSAAMDAVEQLQTRSRHPKGQDMKGSSFRYRFLTFFDSLSKIGLKWSHVVWVL
jgi:hypothetical protein